MSGTTKLQERIDAYERRIEELEAQRREDMALMEQVDAAMVNARERIAELEAALRVVDDWNCHWADGLDSNIEKIKTSVRKALEDK